MTKHKINFAPLATPEAEGDAPLSVHNAGDAARNIALITKLEDEKASLGQQAREAAEWYQREKAKVQANIDYMMGYLASYLDAEGKKSIKTPAGYAGHANRKAITWPSDMELVQWCRESNINVRTTVAPDKVYLRKLIAAGRDIPGVVVEKRKELRVRKNTSTGKKPQPEPRSDGNTDPFDF